MISQKYKLAAAAVLSAMLGACASAAVNEDSRAASVVFPSEETYVPVHKTVIVAGTTMKSDSKNARYDGDAAVKQITPAATTPVIKKEIKKTTLIEKVKTVRKETAPAAPSVAYQIATVYFNDGSAAVDAKYNAEIRRIAKLAKSKNAHVTVYGFASSRTKNTDIVSHKLANFNVSLKRAQNVAAALQRAGLPPKSVAVEALSDTMPLYQEVMPEGERLNRRAEIYISY